MKKKAILCVVLFFTLFLIPGFAAPVTPDSGGAIAPILLQGQGKIETDLLIAALTDRREVECGGILYYQGTIDDYPVLVVDHGVGIINAAGHTAAAIMAFKPYCVINQGTAGGHDPKLKRYDVVLGEETTYINFIFTERRGQGKGTQPKDWKLTTYDFKMKTGGSDSPYGSKSVEIKSIPGDPTLLAKARSVAYMHVAGKVVGGVIGSGDLWNKEYDRISSIRRQFNTSSEDMETFATAMICKYHDVPFLGVRIISNSEVAGDENREFKPDAGIRLQEYVLQITKAIIADTRLTGAGD